MPTPVGARRFRKKDTCARIVCGVAELNSRAARKAQITTTHVIRQLIRTANWRDKKVRLPQPFALWS